MNDDTTPAPIAADEPLEFCGTCGWWVKDCGH
ncbi:hypothetical protein EES44_07845 [Streptomyces sp. ADI96-15]|nr:hypothetical protein EES44_07845 [Streptomyces sp. ADI96-15]